MIMIILLVGWYAATMAGLVTAGVVFTSVLGKDNGDWFKIYLFFTWAIHTVFLLSVVILALK